MNLRRLMRFVCTTPYELRRVQGNYFFALIYENSLREVFLCNIFSSSNRFGRVLVAVFLVVAFLVALVIVVVARLADEVVFDSATFANATLALAAHREFLQQGSVHSAPLGITRAPNCFPLLTQLFPILRRPGNGRTEQMGTRGCGMCRRDPASNLHSNKCPLCL